jgi:hypothetical protein
VASAASARYATTQIHAPRAISFVQDASDDLFESPEDSAPMVEFDPGFLSDAEETLQMQKIIADEDEEDEKESSALEADSVKFEIKWDPLVHIVPFFVWEIPLTFYLLTA